MFRVEECVTDDVLSVIDLKASIVNEYAIRVIWTITATIAMIIGHRIDYFHSVLYYNNRCY